MAAAVSTMENGVRLSSRVGHQQRQRHSASHGAAAAAATAPPPRLPSSSRAAPVLMSSFSSSSSPRASLAFGSSLMPSAAGLLPSAARVGGGSSAASSSTSTRTRNSGGGGGLWASILSFGAAALPASLGPLSGGGGDGGGDGRGSANARASSSSPHRAAHRRMQSAAAADGAGTGTRTSARSSSSSSSSPPSQPSEEELSAAVVERPGMATAAAASRLDVGIVPPLSPPPPPLLAGGALTSRSGSGVGNAVEARAEAAAVAAPAAMVTVSEMTSSMQKQVYLEGANAVYTCSMCRAHLATRDHVVSECFHGHGGRAFLFERCVNVSAGRPEDRMLMTGMHVVADISCKACGADLGWKYEEAAEKSQKYKEGKFILERCAVTMEGRSGDRSCGGGRGGRYGDPASCSDRRGGSSSITSGIIGWGADNPPFADGARW